MNNLFGTDLENRYDLLSYRQNHPEEFPLDKIRIERISAFHYEDGKRKKMVFGYDEHYKLVQHGKWERSLTPAEVFLLLDDYCKGSKKYPDKRLIVEDIIRGEGEFLCLGMQRSREDIHIFEFIDDGLEYDKQRNWYESRSLKDWYEDTVAFDVDKLEDLVTFEKLNNVNPGFVEYLCGMPFEDLADDIKREGAIDLPWYEDHEIRVFAISHGGRFTITSDIAQYASRGVLVEK